MNRFRHIRLVGYLLILIAFSTSQQIFADGRLGADLAAPQIEAQFKNLKLESRKQTTITDDQTKAIISLAAKLNINVFELLDCAHRYLQQQSMRIVITGSSLRAIESSYDLGGSRVLAILPVSKLRYLEIGAILTKGQTALDIYLEDEHESFIEIGTASYEKRFGFAELTPLLFSRPYGITVKKLLFSAPLEKLELYAPGKGAIYVKGLSRPKRWNLDVVTVKK